MLGSVGPEVAMGSLPRKWRNHTPMEQSLITNLGVCQKWQEHRKDQVRAVGPKPFCHLILLRGKKRAMPLPGNFIIHISSHRQ